MVSQCFTCIVLWPPARKSLIGCDEGIYSNRLYSCAYSKDFFFKKNDSNVRKIHYSGHIIFLHVWRYWSVNFTTLSLEPSHRY